jgi:hypothetical protein
MMIPELRDWTSRKHKEHWQPTHGQRQAVSLLKRHSGKRAGESLSLSRNQLSIMMGMLTGHCHVNRHQLRLGLVDNP